MTEPPSPPPEIAARHLMRRLDRAALATVRRDGSGWPYPSLVLTALDHDGAPILLVSSLAEHTLNLLDCDRVGLLFDGSPGLAEPLAGARVSLLGHARRSEAPRHRARYLARHPGARVYDGFGDFAYYRIDVVRAHLVAGFGRVHWIEPGALLLDGPATAGWNEAEEAEEVARINRDHADRVALAGGGGGEGGGQTDPWRLTGLDADGGDLRRDGAVARVVFDHPAASARAASESFLRREIRL